MKKHEYKLFLIIKNDHISDFEIYDNFCEFILNNKYGTYEIIKNSYSISQEEYEKIKINHELFKKLKIKTTDLNLLKISSIEHLLI